MYPEEVMVVKWLAVVIASLAVLRVTRVLAYSVLAPWAEKRAAYKAAMVAAKVADKAEQRRRRIERRDERQLEARTRKAKRAERRAKAYAWCARWFVRGSTVLIQAAVRIGKWIVAATMAWRKRRDERKATPLAEYFVPRKATRDDRRVGRMARRQRRARRPSDDVRRNRVGRFATTTYKVEGEDATLCVDDRSLERFWLPGSPEEDPQLVGFLEERKSLPAPAN